MEANKIELEQLIEMVRKEQPVLGDKSLKVIEICHRLMGGTQKQPKKDATSMIFKKILDVKDRRRALSEIYLEAALLNKLENSGFSSIETIKSPNEYTSAGILRFLFRIALGDTNSIRGFSSCFLFVNSNGNLFIVDEDNTSFRNIPEHLKRELRYYWDSRVIYCVCQGLQRNNKWAIGFNIDTAKKVIDSESEARQLGYIKHNSLV